MRAVLKFDLPGEKVEFDSAVRGFELACQVWEYDQWLRGKLKYEELGEGEGKAYEDAREKLRDFIDVDNLVE